MTKPLVRPATPFDDESGLHVIPLDLLLLKKYGPTYLTWDSESLRQEIEEDFGAVGEGTWARIQAARVLHATPSFWKEWEVFEKVTAAVAGEPPVFSYMQPPDAHEMAVALYVSAKIATHPFDEDVLAYIVAACMDDGLWYLEPPLDVALPVLREYDRRKNIERPYGRVADALKTATGYIDDPQDQVGVQVNLVLFVRDVLRAYQKQEQEQTRSTA